ncbi:MAG: hypothetical protein ABSG94_00440 [Brevinematales bacterium]|jgi:tetratricopeptide (TPR) repeat protein
MKNIILILVLMLFYLDSYPYISKFLTVDTNSLEYRVITNPEAFSLENAAMILSGIKDDSRADLLSRISNFEAGLSADNGQAAKAIFIRMHKTLLKTYDYNSMTLEEAISEGRFNCLSSVLLFNSIMEDFGIEVKAVVYPTHALSMLNAGGREIYIETATPYGFDIGSDPDAQETFEKLTGFAYLSNTSLAEITGKKGLLAYLCENLSFIDHKNGNISGSFQDALKAWAIYPSGLYIYSNIFAAYSSYALYLSDVRKDYPLSISVLEEAIGMLPPHGDSLLNDYFYVEDKYLGSLVESSLYDRAFDELEKTYPYAGTNSKLAYNLYLNAVYRLINHDGDFENAYKFGKIALKVFPDNENIVSIMINGMNLLGRKLENGWQDYPKGDDFILEWYSLETNSYFDSILENHYFTMGSKFYDYGDPEKSIEVLKKGLLYFPKSDLIKNKIGLVAGKTAALYYSKGDYENSIKFLKTGLESDPYNKDIKSNLIASYRTWDSKEIEGKNYEKALAIAEEGLSIFPKDSKLKYYRDYLKKKLK